MEYTPTDSELERYSDAMVSLAEFFHAEVGRLPKWRFIRRRRLTRAWLSAVGEMQWAEIERARLKWRASNAQ